MINRRVELLTVRSAEVLECDKESRITAVPMRPLKFSSDMVEPFTLLTASPIDTRP